MSDLEQILNGEQPEPEAEVKAETPEVEAETAETAAEPDAEPEKAEAKPEPEMVPVSVVAELRRELRELKQLSNRQEPKPAPDVIEDPDGYRNYMQEAVNSSVTGAKLEMSRFMAEREFGKDVVDAAYAYFDDHPDESRALLNAPSPFHAAVEHFNRVKVAQEIGNDPAAYAKKLEAEIRAKLEAELVTKQARDKAGKFAPSMADVTGTGGGPKSNWTGPTPLGKVIGD